MNTHEAHQRQSEGTDAEQIQRMAYLAGMHGPVSIRENRPTEGAPERVVTVGKHTLLRSQEVGEDFLSHAESLLRSFRERRENKTGSRVWQYLQSVGRKFPTTAMLVTAMQTEFPADYPTRDKGEARRRVEKELHGLMEVDLVEPRNAGDHAPLRSKTTQWRGVQCSSSEERFLQKAKHLVRDLKECRKTLRLLGLLAEDVGGNPSAIHQLTLIDSHVGLAVEETERLRKVACPS